MRITALEIAGFRAFPKSCQVDLDADAILVLGTNGQGKTSFFDAILWGLTGNIPRLSASSNEIVSKYSESGEARVSINISDSVQGSLRVVRSYDGERQKLTLFSGDESYQQDSARIKLLQFLWPQGLSLDSGEISLASAITCGVYLQQDLVSRFVNAETDDQQRFNSISELVGSGRVTDLQIELENAKRNWSRVTNDEIELLGNLNKDFESLEHRFESLASISSEVTEAIERDWYTWWERANEVGVQISEITSPASIEAANSLDSAIKQLDALRRRISRQNNMALEALQLLEISSKEGIPAIEDIQNTLEKIRSAIKDKSEALETAESRAAEERRKLVEERDRIEELNSLAQIALRHLGERCPVCSQEYDIDETKKRLNKLISQATDSSTISQEREKVNALSKELQDLELQETEVEKELRDVQAKLNEHTIRMEEAKRVSTELKIKDQDALALTDSLRQFEGKNRESLSSIESLRTSGEKLSLSHARVTEIARKSEIEYELQELQNKIRLHQKTIRTRERTGVLAQEIIDGLREAASELVDYQLEKIGPHLEKIYSRIDPHPSFTSVELNSKFSRGRGRLSTIILDPQTQIQTRMVEAVMSSSQLNALAISVFLAFNLGLPSIPLHSTILDDPMQSLDNVNILGLIDLLRRYRIHRQLMVSTHDKKFGQLLERKLRPVEDGQRIH